MMEKRPCADEREELFMDIQKIINDVVAKLKEDDNLLENFKNNPTKVRVVLSRVFSHFPSTRRC